MGIIVKYFGCFYVYFFMVIILCIYVYIVIGNYLCVFIPMKKFLYSVNVYVFITMVFFIIKNVYAWGWVFWIIYSYNSYFMIKNRYAWE